MTADGGHVPGETAVSSERFFARELAQCFEGALQQRPSVRRYVEVAERCLAFEFAGAALVEPLTRAFVRVSREPMRTRVDLTIRCWDTESTGVSPPAPPDRALLQRGFAVASPSPLRATFSAVSGLLQAYEAGSSVAHVWARAASALPGWEVAAALRTLVAWWSETWSAALLHAAVVGSPSGGVLLAGASGAGKSSTALACVAHGAEYLGDDCALLAHEPGPVAHALYRTAKLDKAFLGRTLPELSSLETELVHDRGKAILAFPAGDLRLLGRCPIRAVCVQRIGSAGPTRLAEVSAARALAALAPSSLLQSPGSGQGTLDALAKLVAAVPRYELQAGRDAAELARAVLGVLS
jgi:hypothetical protein